MNLAMGALLLLQAAGAGQAPLELTLENIYGPRTRAFSASLSPDGAHVAVVANGPDGRGIYRVPTDGSEETGAFWAQGSSPSWSPDSQSIVYLREGDLWMQAVDGAPTLRITNDELDKRDPRVSPDGRLVAFYSGHSGSQDIWVVPTDGSTAPRQVTSEAYAPDDFRWAPAWSPDSRQIAYVSNAADYWHDDVWVVDLESGLTRQVSHDLMASTEPTWSPDGRHIALLGTSKDGYWYEDLADIFVLDPETGSERTVEMQVYGTDWLHNFRVFWSGDGRRIYFPYQERGDFDLWSVPVDGGVATRVTNMGGALSSISASADGGLFAFVRSTPLRGGDVDLIPTAGGPVRRLTRFAATWATVVEPVEVSFRSFDDLYIQGFLYMPPDHRAGDRHPALVNVHGGGTNSYLRGEGLFEQYLASQGYVVLAVNYRGGSGFGREFQDLSINDWANAQARDAAAGGSFLRDQDFVDGKVGIYGYSYGGITTMAAIARVPGVFDAAVPMAGIYDFADAYTNADRIGRIFIKTGHSGSPEERPDVYAVSNTLARIRHIDTPLLVMHGEEDVRAPYRQFELAVAELERLGKTFESVSYPGERHGLTPGARIDMYSRALAFFDRVLKTPPAS